ncbi:teichoic acid biosynthesis protein C [Streptomyces sp. NPDC096934]|uniref:phage baseplate protein n=1 Tax=Streptomyces sp. NPDC096934 TaxID=3155551 RepID=UPI00332DE9E7
MNRTPRLRPARRTVLGLGAAGIAAAALSHQALADTLDDQEPRTGLAAPGELWVRSGRLLQSTVLQSFTVDERRGHLYALQVVQGGLRLTGEARTYSHAERVVRGDLCLNRLTLTGRMTGAMFLKGFGHGTAMGVQETANGPRLWTEWDAHPASGYGRGICRIPFRNWTVLSARSPGLTTFRPVPGSTSNSATLDLGHGRLLLRYRLNSTPRFGVFSLSDLQAGSFRPLADFVQPGVHLVLPFQGMALHGEYAYQLLGSAYGPTNPVGAGGNVHLYRIHWRTGRTVLQIRETTALELHPREPEGLAVSGRGGPKVCMGFTHGNGQDRQFSLYRKPII